MIENFKPIFALTRGPSTEIVVHGTYFIKRYKKEMEGAQNCHFLARSLLNPWQFKSCETPTYEPHWTVALSYHSGQEIHLNALSKIMSQYKVGEEELFCPRVYPLDEETSLLLKYNNKKPQRIHNPSSGKHLMFLAACRRQGFEFDHYWDPDHPIQKILFSDIGKEAREPTSWAYDSCGLPTFFMKASTIVNMWERLACHQSQENTELIRLWLENPYLVGGKGRLETQLAMATHNLGLVKEGNDGLLIIQTLPHEHQDPMTLLLKLSSGYQKNYLGLALLSILKTHKIESPFFETLLGYLESRIDEYVPAGLKFSLIEELN